MKKIIQSLLLSSLSALSISSAGATVIYSENFDVSPASLGVSSTATVGDGKDLAYGAFGYAAFLPFDVSQGKMEFGNPGISADTQASAGVFIDTSSLSAGSYSYTFDILDYAAGGVNTIAEFSLYQGNNDGTMAVRFGSANNPGQTYPIDQSAGASTFSLIGSSQVINGNGTLTATFELTEAGVAGDYLGLAWSSRETADQAGIANPTFSVDNISVASVASVPEPSAVSLLALGCLSVALRRRR